MELAGRIAVVTGASSGIGAATVGTLHAEGMTVVAVARRADRLAALADRLPNVHAHPADVTDDGGVRALAERVAGDFGACHLLVNNAGAAFRGSFAGPQDVGTVARAVDLNLLGAVRCTAALADLLAASAPARVVNVASVAGKVGVNNVAYSSSKFALVGFSEALRLAWAPRGVAVCQLNPGLVRTEGFPQTRFLGHPLTAALVPGPSVVAEAVAAVARSGAGERTVPRSYRPLITLRHLAPRLFWAAAARRPA